jgi:DNA-binding transcriptional LysR family regulator
LAPHHFGQWRVFQIAQAVNMTTYLAQSHVLASSRVEGPGIEDLELSRLALQRRVTLRCQHFWTACKIVSTSNLLLTMPERYARATNAPLDNQVLPFPIATNARDIYLYWHGGAQSDPANRWLRDHIAASFNSPAHSSASR